MKRFMIAVALTIVAMLGLASTADAQYVYSYPTYVPSGAAGMPGWTPVLTGIIPPDWRSFRVDGQGNPYPTSFYGGYSGNNFLPYTYRRSSFNRNSYFYRYGYLYRR